MKNFIKLLILNTFYFIFVTSVDSSLRFRALKSKVLNFEAFYDVVDELFVQRGDFFEIIVYGELSAHVNDTINRVLRRLDGRQPTTINQYDFPIPLVQSSIIFIDMEKFQPGYLRTISFNNHIPKSLKFVLPVDAGFNLSSLVVNPTSHFGHFTQFAYFLVDCEEQNELKTFEWWTKTTCNTQQLITLNTFDKKIMKWSGAGLKLPEKFMKFHGCPINSSSSIFSLHMVEMAVRMGFASFNPAIPYAIEKKESHELRIRNIIAHQGNFLAKSVEENDEGKEGIFSMGEDDNHEYRVFMRSLSYKQYFHCTAPFFELSLDAMYSPPEPYSNYEKMALPFDLTTWMYLGITFGVAFLTIFIINLLPSMFRDTVYGRNVKMPSFNVIGTFFGISLSRLPGNNFARIILMSFTIFCLIFRTAYQGVFFKMMTNEMLRSPPETYSDLKNRNYTLYIADDKSVVTYFIHQMLNKDGMPKLKMIDLQEISPLFYHMSEPSFKSAITVSKIDYKVIKSYERNVPKLMKESILLEPFGACTYPNNFAFKLIDGIMNRLVEAGIPQYHFDYLLNFELKSLLEPQWEPSVFKLSDLEFGFVTWLIACGLAFGTFVAELLWFHLIKRCFRWVQSFCILFAVLQFVGNQRVVY